MKLCQEPFLSLFQELCLGPFLELLQERYRALFQRWFLVRF